jgi:hypothetical protein
MKKQSFPMQVLMSVVPPVHEYVDHAVADCVYHSSVHDPFRSRLQLEAEIMCRVEDR